MESRRRRSYQSRLGEIARRANENRRVTVEELVKQWVLEPSYIKRLFRMALMKYPYLAWDEANEELIHKEPKPDA